MNILRRILFGLLVMLPFIGVDAAMAQSGTFNAAPRIDGFDIEQVQQIAPGTDLNFTLWGTPGAAATLRINGAKRKLVLEEAQVGVYEGTYTVSARDRITADSKVTANLRLGNQVASAALDETIVSGAPAYGLQSGSEPRVERFEVQPTHAIAAGNEIGFTLRGTPGGQATVSIDGARGKFFLPETRPGEYSGSYAIRSNDQIVANSPVTATLRVGDRATTAALGRSLVSANVQPVRSARGCSDCGIVNAVNPIEVKGDGSYLGTIAGGVVGALLGSQVGAGSGKTAAEVLGAVGGAVAGRQIERNTRKSTHYEVVVMLQNGGLQTVSYATEPEFRVGDRVRLVNGALIRNP